MIGAAKWAVVRIATVCALLAMLSVLGLVSAVTISYPPM